VGRRSSISQPMLMTKYSPGVAFFNRGATASTHAFGLPRPFSCCLVREQFALVIRQDRAPQPTTPRAQAACRPPQKNVSSVSRPNLGYRSMITELAGSTLGGTPGPVPTFAQGLSACSFKLKMWGTTPLGRKARPGVIVVARDCADALTPPARRRAVTADGRFGEGRAKYARPFESPA
jgi:hypothetical protein